jgi:Predicted xylanase/chitin deacetylase
MSALVATCERPASAVVLEPTTPGCLVLAYHRVAPLWNFSLDPREGPIVGSDDFTTDVDAFAEQIRLLKASGIRFVKPLELERIIRQKEVPRERCVLVTFDDGDVSQYEHAYPILKREQIPFTLFLISGHVGHERFNGLRMLDWDQVREMLSSGLATIGSHTHDMHSRGSSGQPLFLEPENTKRFAADVRISIATITRETGVSPQYFAYPYGFGSPETDELALKEGLRLLFTLRPGIASTGDQAFYVKRLLVTRSNWNMAAQWAAAK